MSITVMTYLSQQIDMRYEISALIFPKIVAENHRTLANKVQQNLPQLWATMQLTEKNIPKIATNSDH